MLLFRIRSQPGVAYISFAYKKACNIVFKSSKIEKMILLHEFNFVFIWYFSGAIMYKTCCQNQRVGKKDREMAI